MSGNPTTNVVPMPINPVAPPTNWPGPMFMPKTWPPVSGGPSCFSELASLNACWDSVQMMEQILAKVVCDLAKNNTAFQQCLVEAIAASGSNVPRIGVTNGTAALAGQVGEFVSFTNNLNLPLGNLQSQTFTAGVLQPGQWLVWGVGAPATSTDTLLVLLNPAPAGFSNAMWGGIFNAGGEGVVLLTATAHANISVPTLLAFTLESSSTVAQTCAFYTYALRVN